MTVPQPLVVIWRARLWLAIAAIVAAAVAYVASDSRTPVYEADALVRVVPGQQGAGVFLGDVALQQFTNNYLEFARATSVFDAAARDRRLPAGAEPPRDHATVSVDQPGVLMIAGDAEDKRLAAAYANATADAFIRQVADVEEDNRARAIARLNDRVQELRRELAQPGNKNDQALLAELQQIQVRSADTRSRPTDSARLIEPAAVPSSPASPKPVRDAAIALIAILLLGAAFVYLRFLIFNRFASAEEVSLDTGLPVLAELPRAESGDSRSVEAFRALRTNVEFTLRSMRPDIGAPGDNSAATGNHAATNHAPGAPPVSRSAVGRWLNQRLVRTEPEAAPSARPGAAPAPRPDAPVLLVTSPDPSSGKTYLTENLAKAFARDGWQVMAVDADLRRPMLHQRLGLPLQPGVTDVIGAARPTMNGLPKQDVPIPEGATERGGELKMLSAGAPTSDSTEVLATSRMAEMIKTLAANHRLVLLDSPPVLGVADAAILSRYADAVVVVIDAKRSKRRSAKRAVQALRSVDAPLIGVVFNSAPKGEGGYYGYGYYTAETPAPEPTPQPN